MSLLRQGLHHLDSEIPANFNLYVILISELVKLSVQWCFPILNKNSEWDLRIGSETLKLEWFTSVEGTVLYFKLSPRFHDFFVEFMNKTFRTFFCLRPCSITSCYSFLFPYYSVSFLCLWLHKYLAVRAWTKEPVYCKIQQTHVGKNILKGSFSEALYHAALTLVPIYLAFLKHSNPQKIFYKILPSLCTFSPLDFCIYVLRMAKSQVLWLKVKCKMKSEDA